MTKKFSLLLLAAAMFLALSSSARAQQSKKVFYWVSHGAPTDPVWTYFLKGAQQWAADTGNEVRTSFHSGDVPSHQEAIRAAIAAGATGIVTSTPGPGSLTAGVQAAHAKNIPGIGINPE